MFSLFLSNFVFFFNLNGMERQMFRFCKGLLSVKQKKSAFDPIPPFFFVSFSYLSNYTKIIILYASLRKEFGVTI